jgi:flagellum-specific peptidoglycan hydrolase FlgJ
MKNTPGFTVLIALLSAMLLFLAYTMTGQSPRGATEGPNYSNIQVISQNIAAVYGADELVVESYVQAAVNQESQTGIAAAVVVAIAIHESSFNSLLFASSRNPFGIEASKPWRGPTFSMMHDGKKTKFRVYTSAEAAVLDLGDFVKSRPWYADALACPTDDYSCIVGGLSKTGMERGYSMNPNWKPAVLGIIQKFGLQSLIAARL